MTDDEREIAWLRTELAREDDPPVSAISQPCPPAEKIWDAVAGKLGADETRDLVDHVAACAPCAMEWRLALALQLEAGAGEKSAARPLLARRPTWRKWLPLAAALSAIAVGVGFHELRERPVWRGETQEIQSLIGDGAHLSRDRFVLRWTPVPDARSYTVLVQDAAGRLLARREGLILPQAEIPASAFVGLRNSEPVYWLLTANLPGGVKRSPKTWKVFLR